MLYKMPENFEKWTKILVFFFLLSTSSSLHFISFIHSMHSIYNFDHICNVLAAYCWYSVSADENIWWHRLFSIKTTLPNFRSNTIVTRESRVSRVSGTHHQYTRYIHLIIGIWNLSVIIGYEYLVSFHRFPKETLRSSLKLENCWRNNQCSYMYIVYECVCVMLLRSILFFCSFSILFHTSPDICENHELCV